MNFSFKKISLQILVVFLFLFLFLGKVIACSYCSHSLGGLNAGSPILTLSAEPIEKKRFALGYSLQFLNVDEFNKKDFSYLNKKGIHAHSFSSQLLNNANALYGVNDNFNVILSYPYNKKYNLRFLEDGMTYSEGDSAGFGDLSLLTKYRILHLNKHGFSASSLIGIKMATGQKNKKNDLGLKFAPDEQPGTGSWDPILGLLITKRFKNLSLDLNGIYKLSTKGSRDVIVGDSVNYNFALSGILGSKKIFNQKFSLGWSAEMNGLWKEKIELNKIKDNSHGGNTIFLTPGLRIAINENLISSFAVGIPVIEKLNGKQPGTSSLLFFSLNYVY